ncbi:ADP-ribose pyrophosphatase YjhB (NUDIX family) [Clostridium tetanomorphum]|uniref:NUDIX domain-containing protein n=1 Tax=Clostridium tetanomorphum TaxID=1553 RepID=A0A923EC74_CLOTT|nr:NUDIX domain-containing protein [Clostridium tetanomorphum]KAJ51884.1 ADP-ribose pyrophosphatase [Clostridium tetanomorphum DSM 665]MBC2398611.1 NUDIX domain-containing protein [Clostridium tetanomorphum]MBP1864112.1 ADP-ribose pyrophosphatase YjhB (NUDIX family) [Clostridium tetanomorphum]NRS84525.1 ADP-ribose pyrophosphatase YjhB (NUDIX family) [Clostridium tetanomorphum]NRZ97739.1 ADP-ribose pyrophosphatase YjhB (NUDIX family) [Clostridium tetanomorphum]
MDLIKEIYDKDIGINTNNEDTSYKIRKAARTILFDHWNKIAILYVSKNNYHKLPGGGIELGESTDKALRREVKEEVGADIEVLGEIGAILEYRNEFKQLQISYCYYSKVLGEIKKPNYTEEEIKDGFKLKWMNIDEAIGILEKDEPDNYMGKFIKERDKLFLINAKKIIGIKNS